MIAVNGSLLLDELDLVIQAALDGAGLAWVAEDRVAEHLGSGALVRVLEDRCPPFPGFLLYYSSRDSCSLGADRHASRLAESPFGTALMMSAGDAPILETTESDRARLGDVSQSLHSPFNRCCKLLILNGEMSEWLKEHAWKAKRATLTE